MSKFLPLAALLFLCACATSPASLAQTRVEKTVLSSKSAETVATCVAENLTGDAQLRSLGDHYWVIRYTFGTPRHRWDFTNTADGSIAELRSTGLAGSGADRVEECAG